MSARFCFMKERLKPKLPTARQLIALNTKVLREQAGYSQEGLAAVAGFHRTYISQVERSVANVSADGLDKLACALEVPVQRLLQLATETK